MYSPFWTKSLTLLLVALPLSASAALQLTCHARDEAQVTALFDAWAADVSTGDSKAVGDHYKRRAVFKPDPRGKTLRSAKARQTYFQSWLLRQPSVNVIKRHVSLKCNSVVEAGSYSLRLGDGTTEYWRYQMTHDWDGKRWLITTHLITPLAAPN